MQSDIRIRAMSSQHQHNNKDVAALKAELQLELLNKKKCTYQPYECTQMCIDSYKFCLRHILQDKSAPFRQCSYVFATNGKRCQCAAPKIEKKDFAYCNEHALKATLQKNRQNSRCPPPQTAEVLLNSLSHHVRKPRLRNASGTVSDDSEKFDESNNGELKVTKALDPFKDIDAGAIMSATCNNILDLCSESDSDVEAANYTNVWQDHQYDSSDDESVDSEQEDVLKHSSIYTPEEITTITRDKLLKLQSLYIEQYRHLQHIFKEKRRKYIHSLKREKETCCNISNQIRENPKEQRLYKKLKSFNKYHKLHGNEAILSKRNHDVRAKITDGLHPKSTSYTKCTFTEGGVKCGERTLPLTKNCRKHILEDPNQVLFKACGKVKADVECNTPVEAIFDDSVCRLHMNIPSIKSYAQIRKNSESDFEDSFDASEPMTDANNLSLGGGGGVGMPCTTSTPHVRPELLKVETMRTLPSILFEESSCSGYMDSKQGDEDMMMMMEEDEEDERIEVEEHHDDDFKLEVDEDADDDDNHSTTKTGSEFEDENSRGLDHSDVNEKF